MGMNIQRNMFKSMNPSESFQNLDERLNGEDTTKLKPLSSAHNRQIAVQDPKNDYRAFMKDNLDSISALNTLSQKNYKSMKGPLNELRISHKHPMTSGNAYKTMEAGTDQAQGTDKQGSIQTVNDSILTNEFDVKKLNKRLSDNLDSLEHSQNLYAFRSNDGADSMQSSQMILEHMVDARNPQTLNQPRVERLIQIDYVMKNVNSRFKDRILSKFSHDYVKKNLGRDKSLDSETGWMVRNIQRGAGAKFANIMRSVDWKNRMNSPSKGKQKSDALALSKLASIKSEREEGEDDTMFSKKKSTSMDDYKVVNRFVRDMDTGDNIKDGEQLMKNKKYENLDEMLDFRNDTKSRIPVELRMQCESTCNDLDRIIKQKKDK